MTDGVPPYSNVQQGQVPPDVAAEYIVQKQQEDQIEVQRQQAEAADAQQQTSQNQ